MNNSQFVAHLASQLAHQQSTHIAIQVAHRNHRNAALLRPFTAHCKKKQTSFQPLLAKPSLLSQKRLMTAKLFGLCLDHFSQ